MTAPPSNEDKLVSLPLERIKTVRGGGRSRQSDQRGPDADNKNPSVASNIDRVCIEAERFSKKQEVDERATALNDHASERMACLFGCTRILFEITFADGVQRGSASNGRHGEGNNVAKMHILVVTERVANVCDAPTAQTVLVTPTPTPSPTPSSIPESSSADNDRGGRRNKTEDDGRRRRRRQQDGEDPTPTRTLLPITMRAGHGPCIPFEEYSTGSGGTGTGILPRGRSESHTSSAHIAASAHNSGAIYKPLPVTVDHGDVTLGGMRGSISDLENLSNDFAATTALTAAGNGSRGEAGRKSYSYTKEYILCRRIVHALNARYLYAALTRNNTVPRRVERVTQLIPSTTMPFLSFIDGLRLSAQCLLIPRRQRQSRHSHTDKSTNMTTTFTTNIYTLYALPTTTTTNNNNNRMRSYSCPLRCDDRNYFRHDPSGATAQFVFALGCKPVQFESCIFTPAATGRTVPRMVFGKAQTNTAIRSPVPSIIEVKDNSGDREKVVREAIKRLKAVDGFGSVTRADVERTEVRRKNGNTFVVILWFHQRFEQEF